MIAALLLAVFASALSIALYYASDQQDRDINQNRVEQTRQGCHTANDGRRILRASFARELEQTRLVPAEAFAQFNVTKRDAIQRLEDAQVALHPLDCAARVEAVREPLD